jgi:3-phosphoshikimate 1-carboxyvinyltransferase
MSIFRIKPSQLQGRIKIPPSKSHTLRAILFAMMGKGKSIVRNYLLSPDTEAMISAATQFGAQVSVFSDFLEILGTGGKLMVPEDVIQSGNSGQVLRFMGAMAALVPGYTIITGDHSIRHYRPVKPLLDALSQLGAFANSSRLDGYAPIIVRGPMTSHFASLQGQDSQPVSALLIACSFLSGETTIVVSDPGEKPWIDLTLDWLKYFDVHIENNNYENYKIPGKAAYDGFERNIPGDFSSAAYPLVAALITGSELILENVDMNDVQGDKKMIDLLIKMGAKIDFDDKQKALVVKRSRKLKGLKVDLNDLIDMITILPVLACFSDGETEIVNAGIARKKESDRIYAIANELKKMGADIEERQDGLIIKPSLLKGAHLQSYSDHRVALALSVAAFAANGESLIEGIGCIKKTYPTFQYDFQSLGASIQ